MIVGAYALAPRPGELKGVALFGDTREEAEREAKVHLGLAESVN
jgi:hypothetical protein